MDQSTYADLMQKEPLKIQQPVEKEKEYRVHILGKDEYKEEYYRQRANFNVLNDAHLDKKGFKPVRDTIEKIGLGQKYEAFDKLYTYPSDEDAMEQQTNKIALHHSYGTRLLEAGEDVVEINCAGTSFELPRLDYRRSKGKDFDKADKTNILGESYAMPTYVELKPKLKKKKGVYFWNKIKFLNKYFKVATVEQIKEYNKEVDEYNQKEIKRVDRINAEHKKAADEGAIDQIYGKEIKLDKYKAAKVRKKEKIHKNGASKVRYSFAGANTFNTNKASIENTEMYILEVAKKSLIQKFQDWEQGISKPKTVNLLLEGHSRGGVSAMLGAMRVKKWLETDPLAQQYQDYVKFDIQQYDPVPGNFLNGTGFEFLFHHYKEKKEVNLRDEKYKSEEYAPLGKSANSTVVYTLRDNYESVLNAFAPQQITGANRLIFTVGTHSANMDYIDTSQGKHTKANYKVQTGDGKVEAFRGSALREIPDGVYVADEMNNLIKLDSYEQFLNYQKNVVKESGKLRWEVCQKAAKAWFDAHQ